KSLTTVPSSSLIVQAHLRLHLASPPSAGQSHRSFPYLVTSLLPYLTITLSSCPDPVGVTAHYCSKPFSCNTYKNHGGSPFTEGVLRPHALGRSDVSTPHCGRVALESEGAKGEYPWTKAQQQERERQSRERFTISGRD